MAVVLNRILKIKIKNLFLPIFILRKFGRIGIIKIIQEQNNIMDFVLLEWKL